MFESVNECSVGERIAIEESFDERKIGKIAEERSVPSEQKLLRIESAEVSSFHLRLEVVHGSLEQGPERNPEINSETLPPVQSFPSNDADELGVLLEEVETGGQDVVNLPPSLHRVEGCRVHSFNPTHEG
ncbi:unannotated protein [freshwater metagenome]|uniref:Unannotated protein n=1 Tax=freshwater metagenome TaxID=449393 RepID=A0A6J7KVV2_9ZZZZ